MPLQDNNSVELDLIEEVSTKPTRSDPLLHHHSEESLKQPCTVCTENCDDKDKNPRNLIPSKINIKRFFPIFSWLPNYKVGQFLLSDLIAGITVSVLQIPHGLAFAPLAGQPPVVGLYMAIFPIIMYTILGTSPHLSLGMQAILIMMVGKIVDTHSVIGDLIDATNNGSQAGFTPLEVGIAVTFSVGAWQLLLGIVNFGFLCVLLSNSVVSAFTCGAAVHIIFIQLKHIFGIPLKMSTGPFKLCFSTVNFIYQLPLTNFTVLAISISFILVLYVYNDYLKNKVSKKIPIPIPMEFLLVLSGVGLSAVCDLKSADVPTVGPVPGELPALLVPPFSLIPTIAFDCLIIALVNISLNIALAKIFAKKGGYDINENQELIAYGVSNIFGGFFQCLPVCAAISRSMIQFSVGGKTQLTHAFSLLSVLLMLLFLGGIFEMVPLCVLSAIVVVNMKALVFQISDFFEIWRLDKRDGLVWLSTFLSVIFLDVDYGIGIGLLSSIIALFLINVDGQIQVLGKVIGQDIFLDSKTYKNVEFNSKVAIFKIIGNVNFYNGPLITKKTLKLLEPILNETSMDQPSFLIIDISCVPCIDPSGVQQLFNLKDILKSNNCDLILASCSTNVSCYLKRFFPDFVNKHVKASVGDAVLSVQNKLF